MKLSRELLREMVTSALNERYGGNPTMHAAVTGIKKFMEVGSQLTDQAYLEHMVQGFMGGGVYQILTDVISHLDNMGEDEEFRQTLQRDMDQLRQYVGTNNLAPNPEGFRELMGRVAAYVIEKFPSDMDD